MIIVTNIIYIYFAIVYKNQIYIYAFTNANDLVLIVQLNWQYHLKSVNIILHTRDHKCLKQRLLQSHKSKIVPNDLEILDNGVCKVGGGVLTAHVWSSSDALSDGLSNSVLDPVGIVI